MKNRLLRYLFKKQLIQTNLSCKKGYYNLFLKNNLFKTTYFMQNILLCSLFKKQLIMLITLNELIRVVRLKLLIGNDGE